MQCVCANMLIIGTCCLIENWCSPPQLEADAAAGWLKQHSRITALDTSSTPFSQRSASVGWLEQHSQITALDTSSMPFSQWSGFCRPAAWAKLCCSMQQSLQHELSVLVMFAMLEDV